ncbi:MAG: DUF433 domain-containing protein [Acidobacteriota bacterium]|nr:DUF433 domain-containing protein [Acidobacteriota bacterium]
MSKKVERDLYRGRDPRQIPAYTLLDAARYLHIPERTIRNWAYGYPYATKTHGRRQTPPLIEPESGAAHDFSFFNLVELHVLAALRREHRVHMASIRAAIDYLKRRLGSPRPLINEEMATDGTDLFVSKLGSLINVSQNGQLAMKALLKEYLKRVERDVRGIPVRLFPFTRPQTTTGDAAVILAQPRLVSIDPAIAFGRPVVSGSRVPTAEIFERFIAGESPKQIAADFGRTVDEIHEAIRCENTAAAA